MSRAGPVASMPDDLAAFRTTSPDPFEGNYLLGDALGSGGMGTVYRAIQVSVGRRVAIKLPHAELANDPFVIRRFRAEAAAGGRLDHRNIARVIDLGGRDGALFLVMELVSGTPLDKLLTDSGGLEVHVATELCGQILAGLHAAHTAGVIHADLKSGNVLVEWPANGTPIARIIDFGLARFRDAPASADDRLVSGTPDFLAPELIMVSAGFDAHRRDPLAMLELTEDDFGWVTRELVTLAQRHARGRLVSVLEGGYDLTALANSSLAHLNALRAA